MPQLDFATFPGQLFWLAILFVFLYVLVSRTMLPKISTVIEDRERHIGGDLDKAEDMKNKAEEVETKTTLNLQIASEEVRQIIEESREKVDMRMQVKREELATKLEKTTKDAEKKIAAIEDESDKVVAKISKDISALISQKLVA